MQSIINANGFGFCKASGFRNCNNCIYRLRCITYTPTYAISSTQSYNLPTTFNLQAKQIFEKNSNSSTNLLEQENIALKERIQDLENQLLNLSQTKNIDAEPNKVVSQEEENFNGLQVYDNKISEISLQENNVLKPKKGLFGTKFVEDKSKKK